MEQFLVPQFIDAENRIIGPITVRQFVLMLASGLSCVLWYSLFDFTLFLLVSLLVVGTTAVFAFVKINGQQFQFFLINMASSLFHPKLLVWHKEKDKVVGIVDDKENLKTGGFIAPLKPRLGHHRLSELSLIVNTGGQYRGSYEDIVK